MSRSEYYVGREAGKSCSTNQTRDLASFAGKIGRPRGLERTRNMGTRVDHAASDCNLIMELNGHGHFSCVLDSIGMSIKTRIPCVVHIN